MKTYKDPRHIKRREIVKELFAISFTPQNSRDPEVADILSKLTSIDNAIQQAAPTWPIDKLNKVDLAVLRLAVYEFNFTKTPPKVIIDEAIELSKEYGSESSPSFINGVLGTIYQQPN